MFQAQFACEQTVEAKKRRKLRWTKSLNRPVATSPVKEEANSDFDVCAHSSGRLWIYENAVRRKAQMGSLGILSHES